MVDPNLFLQSGLMFHGHKCPAMPLGLRLGAAAMNTLGVARAEDGQLLALVELGEEHCSRCLADGIQMITGCTFGKGNIKQLGYGKFALTLVDRASRRAVRVAARAEAQAAMKQTAYFTEYRAKGVPASQVPDEVVEPLLQNVLAAPQEKLLVVGEEFHFEVSKPSETSALFVCDRCGESVVEKYGRVIGQQRVCIPCQDKALAGT